MKRESGLFKQNGRINKGLLFLVESTFGADVNIFWVIRKRELCPLGFLGAEEYGGN